MNVLPEVVPDLLNADGSVCESEYGPLPARRRAGHGKSDPVVALSIRTDAILSGLELVLRHHDAPSPVLHALREQLHAYADTCSSEMVWLKRMKFVLAYPLAKYLRNAAPPSPDVAFKPVGVLRRWMKSRLLTFNRTNSHLWYSWFQAKRAALTVSSAILQENYVKHRDGLSKPDDGDDETIERILSDRTMQFVIRNLREQVNKLVPQYDPLSSTPSSSACFEASRKQGGQCGELLRLTNRTGRLTCKLLSEVRWAPTILGPGGCRHNVTYSVYTVDDASWWELPNLVDYSVCDAQIQAVCEPLKVRVISKGPAVKYYMARNLQRALHGTMREMQCFRLIGRPLCPTDVFDLARKARPSDKWASIDYSAATDNLSWKYSGRILDELICDLPEEWQTLYRRVLGPHRIHYDAAPAPLEAVMQQRGQLMGSILSFPLLCLANLGVYLDVTSESQRDWRHDERLRHVLVNGDDMVYATDDATWDRHIVVAGKVGLEMSVGKAYLHSTYLNVNSTSIHFNLQALGKGHGPTPWQIDYLPSGLFLGRHKVQEKVEGPTVAGSHRDTGSFATNIDEIVKGCLPGKYHQVLAEYMKLHSAELAEETQGRNLFVPIALGGMGLTCPPGFKYKINKHQRALAAKKIMQYDADGVFMDESPCRFMSVNYDSNVDYPVWYKPMKEDEKEAERRTRTRATDLQVSGKLMRMPELYACYPTYAVVLEEKDLNCFYAALLWRAYEDSLCAMERAEEAQC